MTLAYRLHLEPDGADLLVTAPALPEVTTSGTDDVDAAAHGIDAVEEALAARIAAGLDIPDGDGVPDAPAATLPLLTELKVELYRAARRQGVIRAELARRLGWHREQVDRLFRLDHASHVSQLEAAFAALGLAVRVSLADAA